MLAPSYLVAVRASTGYEIILVFFEK